MLDDIAEEIRPVIAGRDHDDIAARGMTGGMVHRYTGSDRLRVGGDRLQPTVFAGDLHPLHGWVSGLTVVDQVCQSGSPNTTLASPKYGVPAGAIQPM